MEPYTLVVEGNPAPSLNALLRFHWAQRSKVKKQASEGWMQAAVVHAVKANCYIAELLAHGEPRKIDIKLYFKTRRRRDPDNYLKVLLDALVRAGILADDNQEMCQTTIELLVDKERPRSEVTISEWEGGEGDDAA